MPYEAGVHLEQAEEQVLGLNAALADFNTSHRAWKMVWRVPSVVSLEHFLHPPLSLLRQIEVSCAK